MKNGLLIGVVLLAAAGCITYAVTGDTGISLIAVCIVLILLPPAFDPAIIIKEWQVMNGKHPESPSCYGDYPFMYPVEAAERDCVHCSHAYGCHEDSPDPRINR